MKLRIVAHLIFAATMLGGTTAIAADLVIIDLHNRTAEELLPILKPVAGAAALSGTDYKLFVRGDAADVGHVRQLLQVLDRAPRQLIVSVRYTGTSANDATASEARGNVNNREIALTAGAIATSTAATQTETSSVRMLEGGSAHISSGQLVPMISAAFIDRARGNRYGTAGIATEYRERSTGFDVTPRVSNTGVVLDIAMQFDVSGGDTARAQSIKTTVSGRLGEWIELGGIGESSNAERSSAGLGASHRLTTQSDQRKVSVKVELSE
jgi:type II secretory pathway component GspD/PulD (secretin)